MIYFNVSLFIVSAFLVLTLIVGICFSRKKTTFREYAVGNKNFATATLVATVLATLYGGAGLINELECAHVEGLWWILISFLSSFGLWIIGRLALRMGPFMQHLSMAETVGSIYGRYPRAIAALVGVCNSIVIITSQINVMSHAIRICLVSIDPFVITILATLLLIFYSTFGGIRAVTLTDILQFITFSIIIPLLAWFVFVKLGKPVSEPCSILQNHKKFQFATLFSFNTQLVGMLLLLPSFIISYIEPPLMQRVYMASNPIQARKVFSYATIFSCIIGFFISLIGVFVFVGEPDLPKEAVWSSVIAYIPPFFKGFLAVSLLAMTMSTADSCLNTCAVMVSHDILQGMRNKKELADTHQLKIARRTTVVVGLFAMLLAFKCRDLLKLMYWSVDSIVPIVTAPFILAVFGFRGTSRTALIGMVTGIFTILVWNKWVEPSTGIDGSFIAMLANGLAMMAAHYLFKQPETAGWVGPDDQFKQMQQADARKAAERKEAIKNAWANKKIILTNLIPSHTKMVYVGLYVAAASLLAYFMVSTTRPVASLILKLFLAACFVGYPFLYDISKKVKSVPGWFVGLVWLMTLSLYLPLNLLWHWWHLVDATFNLSLSLTHCIVILSVLPLYFAIRVVTILLLLSIYPIAVGLSFSELSSLLPLFMAGLLIFAVVISLKIKLVRYMNKNFYLEYQENIRKSRKLKSSLYDAAIIPSDMTSKTKSYGTILAQVVAKIEESISFLDSNMPLYKQDFQSIINKLYDWVAYFNRREKAKHHALLQPTQISLNKLIRKVEFALSQEVLHPPRLLVESIRAPEQEPCPYIVCDINQVVYLLVQAVLRIGKTEGSFPSLVRVQLHSSSLQFMAADSIDDSNPLLTVVQAIGMVISEISTPSDALPKVKHLYDDRVDSLGPQGKHKARLSIDLQQETISTIVGAHYGYMETSLYKKKPTMLLVLPNDVTQILSKITAKLPIDCLTSDAPVTPKEEADSMMALMQFHDYVSKSTYPEDPIDIATISRLLLLLRQHFVFKRHVSGQLFYVRAVGIAALVVEWVFHAPKVIYASLLYELVRHTCLPLSYVKKHYNLGVYAFVLNVVKIDKHQELDHPSLVYVQNRLKEAIKEDHIQLSVLFIKLAERLYDLNHAASYIHLTEVQHMAQETLAIDVKLAHTYLSSEIGAALEKAAKEALAFCQSRSNDQEKSERS